MKLVDNRRFDQNGRSLDSGEVNAAYQPVIGALITALQVGDLSAAQTQLGLLSEIPCPRPMSRAFLARSLDSTISHLIGHKKSALVRAEADDPMGFANRLLRGEIRSVEEVRSLIIRVLAAHERIAEATNSELPTPSVVRALDACMTGLDPSREKHRPHCERIATAIMARERELQFSPEYRDLESKRLLELTQALKDALESNRAFHALGIRVPKNFSRDVRRVAGLIIEKFGEIYGVPVPTLLLVRSINSDSESLTTRACFAPSLWTISICTPEFRRLAPEFRGPHLLGSVVHELRHSLQFALANSVALTERDYRLTHRADLVCCPDALNFDSDARVFYAGTFLSQFSSVLRPVGIKGPGLHASEGESQFGRYRSRWVEIDAHRFADRIVRDLFPGVDLDYQGLVIAAPAERDRILLSDPHIRADWSPPKIFPELHFPNRNGDGSR